MSSVSTKIEVVEYSGDIIGYEQFGTNMLFHSDEISERADFVEVIDDSGIKFIRYPGGTISEEYFDPADPNASRQVNIVDVKSGASRVRERDVLPLNEYLEYIEAIDGEAVIVLPTYRYFDPETGSVFADAEAEIRDFIRKLAAGEFGPIENFVLEIGNEWYQHRFDWTIEEFGQVQEDIASWVHDELTLIGIREDVTLLAQAGRSTEQNELLADHFSGDQAEYIDGVISHLYGTNSNGDPLNIGGGIGRRLEDINSVWSERLGNDFTLAVTEWNVGESGESTTIINGLMRSAPLLRIFGEMLEQDVDLAMIWATQTNGPAGLSSREGEGSELSPTGYLYSMLIDGTVGMQLLETKGGVDLLDAEGNHKGYAYHFANEEDFTSYYVSGVNEDLQIEVDISEVDDPDAYYYAAILGAAPGEDGIDYHSDASIRYITDMHPKQNVDGSWSFDFELEPYETLQLRSVVGKGIVIEGDSQNAISDKLIGTQYDDALAGDIGNDVLEGNGGDDYLRGGSGDDYIRGGDGNDVLEGGDRRDPLLLEGGADELYGDAGDDIILMDNSSGIVSGGDGIDTLSFEGSSEGVNIWTFSDQVETEKGGVDFSEIERFVASKHDDRISIAVGNAEFHALEGDDFINLSGGSHNRVYAGEGSDYFLIQGGVGNVLFGGAGQDTFMSVATTSAYMDGGTDDDKFVLRNNGVDVLIFDRGDGADQVFGFQTGVDRIELHDVNRSEIEVTSSADGILLDFGDGGSIFLEDTKSIDLETDIVFL